MPLFLCSLFKISLKSASSPSCLHGGGGLVNVHFVCLSHVCFGLLCHVCFVIVHHVCSVSCHVHFSFLLLVMHCFDILAWGRGFRICCTRCGSCSSVAQTSKSLVHSYVVPYLCYQYMTSCWKIVPQPFSAFVFIVLFAHVGCVVHFGLLTRRQAPLKTRNDLAGRVADSWLRSSWQNKELSAEFDFVSCFLLFPFSQTGRLCRLIKLVSAN